MIRGNKTSEFYVVVVMLAVWIVKYLGLDAYITPENVNQVAQAIKEGHVGGFDGPSVAGLLYVAGRVLIKAIDSKSSPNK